MRRHGDGFAGLGGVYKYKVRGSGGHFVGLMAALHPIPHATCVECIIKIHVSVCLPMPSFYLINILVAWN